MVIRWIKTAGCAFLPTTRLSSHYFHHQGALKNSECSNNLLKGTKDPLSLQRRREEVKTHDVILAIGVIGIGNVGREFLVQLFSEVPPHVASKITVPWIANSRETLRFHPPLVPSSALSNIHRAELESLFSSTTLESIKEGLKAYGHESTLESICPALDSITNDTKIFDHFAVVDNSACERVTDLYVPLMQANVSIVTPNKKANSGCVKRDKALRELNNSPNDSHWLYEATIGAGLPVIATLQTLQLAGDKIRVIQGVFSGTMSYLFNTYDGSRPWSAVVRQAKELGYTEPDPRDDLSGIDVARKVVIAARECGWQDASIEEVSIESLVPSELATCSVDEFLTRLTTYDALMEARVTHAKAQGNVLRFVGVCDLIQKTLSVRVIEMPSTHAFASLQGAQNVIEIESSRYRASKLTISGPGAGAEVTAGGVLGDLGDLLMLVKKRM